MFGTQGLSLDQAPPIGVPFRFFLTAPLFLAAAGVLLLVSGPDILASRWTPASLAVTHLLTLGFLAQVMTGALMQLLPVLAGTPVPMASLAGRWIHLSLVGGAGLLAAGFLGAGGHWLTVGAAASGLGLGLLALVVGIALARTPGRSDAVWTLRLSLLALLPTVGLGLLLAAGLAGLGAVQDFATRVDQHLAWGLLGWTGLLLIGLLAELVPMFYVTQAYPAALRKVLPPVVFCCLTLWTISGPGVAGGALGLGVAGAAVMALVTLWMTQRRKRPVYDATLFHLWIGCAALVAAALAWALSVDATLIGVLVLGGVVPAFPIGILFKVVPFLCWFHLQGAQLASGRFDARLPTMRDFLPERQARRQLGLYLAALVVLLIACRWPEPWSRIGGLGLVLTGLALFTNLAMASLRYRKALVQVERKGVN